MKKRLLRNAAKISILIQETNTDYRGDLFMEISKQLTQQGQAYTGTLFKDIAIVYGISEVNK